MFPLGWHLNRGSALPPPTATATAARGQGPLLLVAGHVAHGRCSQEHALRLRFLVACSQPVVSQQLRSGLAQSPPTRLFRSALSQHVAPCQPRAAESPAHLREQPAQAPRSPVDVSFFLCLGGSGTSAHTKDKHTGIITLETPLAERQIGLRTPLQTEPDRSSRELLGL